MDAARSPEWSFGLGRQSQIMATRDSGQIGLPWVVLVEQFGRGMRVSFYQPGDNIEVEGDVIGQLSGNPREMGRQLRTMLEEIDLGPHRSG